MYYEHPGLLFPCFPKARELPRCARLAALVRSSAQQVAVADVDVSQARGPSGGLRFFSMAP